jgi:hypothetical protein
MSVYLTDSKTAVCIGVTWGGGEGGKCAPPQYFLNLGLVFFWLLN